jgi:hypothetical protein
MALIPRRTRPLEFDDDVVDDVDPLAREAGASAA